MHVAVEQILNVLGSHRSALHGLDLDPQNWGRLLSELIRVRYNTMADQTPDCAWKWRVIFERDDGYEEVLVKQLLVNVPSFSRDDTMPVVGRKYHMACVGIFRIENGIGIVDLE